MKRQKKQYQTPRHPWQAARIKSEAELMRKYGLKNKKEVWRASSKLRNWRAQARKLVGLSEEKRKEEEKHLFNKLTRHGLLTENADLDEVLGLQIEQVLDNRLQTRVYKKGLASTVKQARQFIVHGKVLVNDDVVTAPSYSTDVKDKIELVPGFSPVKTTAKKSKKKGGASEEKTPGGEGVSEAKESKEKGAEEAGKESDKEKESKSKSASKGESK